MRLHILRRNEDVGEEGLGALNGRARLFIQRRLADRLAERPGPFLLGRHLCKVFHGFLYACAAGQGLFAFAKRSRSVANNPHINGRYVN